MCRFLNFVLPDLFLLRRRIRDVACYFSIKYWGGAGEIRRENASFFVSRVRDQDAISEVPIGQGSLLMEKYVLITRLQSIFKGRWTLARVFATKLVEIFVGFKIFTTKNKYC
jgi:hypothetical protein